MIDYGKGYSSSWRMMVVDRDTWAATDELQGLVSASVERDKDSDLIESGSASFDAGLQRGEFWGRLEMLAEQDGEVERHAVATLLFSPGDSTSTVGGKTTECSGRSVLAPAEDKKLLAGTYAPMGADGAAYAASMIAACTPAPVVVEGSFTLSQNYVFAEGTTYLESARTILDGAGWQMSISGGGTVTVGPKPTNPSLVLDSAHASLLGVEIGVNGSLEEVPNRYIAIDGDRQVVAVDDSRDNPASLSNRGRYVDEYDSSPQLVDGESLEAYARRKLAEANESLESRTYTREWWPDVTVGDIVVGSMASVDLDCTMRVSTQSLEVGNGVVVSEKAEVLR
ncbi:MAG: hypothetical protein IKL97_05180 [Eggerthellaceae bacterium]|nr:hypothetical protein [Eggerthellaceae bacterium]